MAADDAPPPLTLELPVALTTKAEANTLAVPLRAVASVPVDDVRFEFDSSFLLPDATRALERVAPLHERWKHAPVTLFGHTDRIGDEDYNKKLSGRRVRAVYGLLIRDTAIWEDLYQHPLDADNWQGKPPQHMLQLLGFDPGPIDGNHGKKTKAAVKSFQAAHGLGATGNLNPSTREALFTAYMDQICRSPDGVPFKLEPKDFLGRGEDADGKADYQGCGEFNPIFVPSKKQEKSSSGAGKQNKREFFHAVNRRVTLFFLAPGTEVVLDEWPCPTAKEGPGDCRKRFWSDGPARLKPQDEMRRQRETHDTYACRFYERLTLTAEPGEDEALRPGLVRARWSKTEVLALHNKDFPPATPPTDAIPDDSLVELQVDVQGVADGTPAQIEIRHAKTDQVVGKLEALEVRDDAVVVPDSAKRPTWTFDASHHPYEVWDKMFFYIAAKVGDASGESPHDLSTEEGLLRVRPLFLTIADAIADTPAGGGLTTVDEMYEIGNIEKIDPARGVHLVPFNQNVVPTGLWGSVIRNTYAYHQTSHGDVQCRIDGAQFNSDADSNPTVCPNDPTHPPRSVLYIGNTAIGDNETNDVANVPSVPRYLVYINTCVAGYEPSFADALIGRGCRNVVAFKKYIPDDQAREMARQFHRKWSQTFRDDPQRIPEVYFSVSPPYFKSMKPVLYGEGAGGPVADAAGTAVGNALGALV